MTTTPDQTLTTTGAEPAATAVGDKWIIRELEAVRYMSRLLGGLPAFRRGRMYLDYSTGKIRVAEIGGAGC